MKRFLGFPGVLVLIWCGMMPLDAAQVIRGPYLQSAASDRMTVCWRTDVATTSEVAYGLEQTQVTSAASVGGTRTEHEVVLTALTAGTRYFYRIKGTPAAGASIDLGGSNHWFRTAAPSGSSGPFRVWVVGDSGYPTAGASSSYTSYMAATAAEGKYSDAFMMLGDNAYDIGTDSQYQSFVFDRYATLLRNTPIWSAFGNHDAYTSTLPNYTGPVPYDSMFRFPTAGECGGVASGSERYYSFNHGNIHFISLDTNTVGIYDDLPGGPYGMVDWLLDDLRGCTADWIIAIMHQGPYSKSTHDSDVEWNLLKTRDYVVPLLESYGADLILCGHSHVYERSRMIDGHYGNSPTFNQATMVKWPGNGSDLGGVAADGSFTTSPGSANGAFQKPAALGRSGTVYAVAGASSSPQGWLGGSTALVSPAPHPVHQVNLNLLGSMVIEVDGQRLNSRYLGESGATRDDFTILKGSTYTLQGAVPTTEGALSGVAFPVTRTGSTAFSEQVPVAVDLISGDGVTPSQAIAEFAAGQSSTEVKFFPAGSDPETRFEARLLPTMRSVQPGAAPRAAYRISGGPQIGYFGPTDPMNAATWYHSRFGAAPSGPEVWVPDEDGDGLSLLLEYALGGEPGRNDAALLPRGNVEAGSFIYRYTRPPGRSDLSYEILGSADLGSWPPSGLSDVNDGPVTALGEPRKVELPIGSPLKFLRIKVVLQSF